MTYSPLNPRISIQDGLYGPIPFYKQTDYLETTKADFSEDHPSFPHDYEWDSEGMAYRGARRTFTALPPFSIAAGIHTIAGNYLFLPASNPSKRRKEEIRERRNNIDLNGEWKYRRISVLVNGCKIDGAILGKESTLNNRQWMIVASGNNSRYETVLNKEDSDAKKILTKLGYNGLLFSYPGVGSSQGFAGKKAMVNAHSAILAFAIDDTIGLGGEKVILYGYSTGGGIQAEILSRSIPPQVKLAIKDRTFTSSSKVATENNPYAQTAVKYVVKAIGWDIQTLPSSQKLPIPEIVMQTKSSDTTDWILSNATQVVDDGKIPAKAALATKLLRTPETTNEASVRKPQKVILGLPERHSDKLQDPSIQQLTDQIKSLIKDHSPSVKLGKGILHTYIEMQKDTMN